MKSRSQASIEKDLRELSEADRMTVCSIAYQLRSEGSIPEAAMRRLLRDVANGDGDAVRMVHIAKF